MSEKQNRQERLNEADKALTGAIVPKTYFKYVDDDSSVVNAGNFDLVLLAATKFAKQEYKQAATLCADFERPFSDIKTDGLAGRVRGQVQISKVLRILSESIPTKEFRHDWPNDCAVESRVLFPIEGRIFESLFSESAFARSEDFGGKPDLEKIQSFCVKSTNMVKFLTNRPCSMLQEFAASESTISSRNEEPPKPDK